MTVDDIKAALSTRCIEALANSLGYSTDSPKNDYGIDLSIIEHVKRTNYDGSISHYPSNREIKLQLKATTQKQVTIKEGVIKYNLRVKNYNDIVCSVNNQRPIYLFLIIMPEDDSEWLHYSPDELTLRSRCYWYIHPKGTKESENKTTHVIEIPETQMIETTTFAKIIDDIYY